MNTDGEETDRSGDSEMENERDPMSSMCFEDTSSTGTDNEMDTSMASTVSSVSCVSSQSTLSASSMNVMDSTVCGVSSQSTLSTSSVNLSMSSDSVWVGTTSDRFVHIIVILLLVFFHDLLKTKLCYIVLNLALLIFTVAAAAAVWL